MGRITFHRILGLLVLLGLGLMFGGSADASNDLQGVNTLSAYPDTHPSWYITARTGSQVKPACLHALEHSHESCRACGKTFVLRSTGRLRAKAVVKRSKPNNSFLLVIQLNPTVEADRVFLRRANGSLSQASHTGAAIFARTGRLRI